MVLKFNRGKAAFVGFPKAALISCGEKNRYGHPHKETLGRLTEFKCQVFRTDYNGAVQIRSDGIGFIVNCYKKKR